MENYVSVFFLPKGPKTNEIGTLFLEFEQVVSALGETIQVLK